MNNDILFVTAFKDINRKSWSHYTRTNEEYYKYFINLAKGIEYNLIVYVEDYVKKELLLRSSFGSNVIFCNINDVFTFMDKYLENDKIVMASNIYKNKIPNERKNNPEHIYSEYNLMNHNKINFISNAKVCYPDYSFYSWIDFGFVREEMSIPRNINISKLPHKIIYHNILVPSYYIDPNDILKTDNIYLTGSGYIIHSSLVKQFENLYDNKIKELHKNFISDDDQSVVLQIYFDNPNIFHLIQNNNWFSIFNIL